MCTIKNIREQLKKDHEKENDLEKSFPEDNETIEEVIKKYVTFSHPTRNGYHPVFCEVCGDGTKSKGPRGGWKFEFENAYYNCFNCGITGSFTPTDEFFMSKDMKKIFESYDIPKKEWGKILFRCRKDESNIKSPIVKSKKFNIEEKLSPMVFPDYLQELNKVKNSKFGKLAIQYLDEKKHINYKDYPFLVSKGETKSKNPKDKSNSKITIGRLIIPIFFKEHLLLIQAVDILGSTNKKYINIGSVKKAIYGLDSLEKNDKYIFISEGFWDAYHMRGLAVFTNNISSHQIEIINKYFPNKPKVTAPDKLGDYNTLAERGIKQNWGLSAPKEFKNIKDVTDTITKYGKLYTLEKYIKSTVFEDEAELHLKFLK